MDTDQGIDVGPIVTLDEMGEATDKIREALSAIATGHIDSGMGCGSADLWPVIDGVEYYVCIKAKRRIHNA